MSLVQPIFWLFATLRASICETFTAKQESSVADRPCPVVDWVRMFVDPDIEHDGHLLPSFFTVVFAENSTANDFVGLKLVILKKY